MIFINKIIEFLSVFYGLPLIPLVVIIFFLNSLEIVFNKKKNINKFNIKINNNHSKYISYNFYSKLAYKLTILPLILLTFSKAFIYSSVISSEIKITSNNLSVIHLLLIFIVFLSKYILDMRAVSYKQTLNIMFTLIFFLIPYIYLFNSITLLLFFIELINLIVFLLVINSLNNPNIINKIKKPNSFFKTESLSKINLNIKYSIFIYYWISFFFSIIFFLLLGTLSNEFNFLEQTSLFLVSSYKGLININFFNLHINIPSILLTLIFIIKLGLPPLHFQKILIYKGLPLNVCFLFSIIIIICYYYILSNLVLNLPHIFNYTRDHIKVISVIYLPFILFSLFKESNIKLFFGYSSIINILILLICISFL